MQWPLAGVNHSDHTPTRRIPGERYGCPNEHSVPRSERTRHAKRVGAIEAAKHVAY